MERVVAHIRNIVKQQGQFKPLFVTDIDGVLVRGPTPVQGTRDAVVALRNEGIPLALLTNGGGYLEGIKADKMNEIFKENIFDRNLMFMSHSPIRPHLRKYSQEGGVLLLTGSLKITDIVDEMGINNYITADELHSIFHGPN
jgi:ribonucleotide monophosphatase NagD (HAD superfamily)